MDQVDMVVELRDETGVGMAQCKKALEQSDWDMDRAIEYLKKNRNKGCLI